jgi:hypothetical protein
MIVENACESVRDRAMAAASDPAVGVVDRIPTTHHCPQPAHTFPERRPIITAVMATKAAFRTSARFWDAEASRGLAPAKPSQKTCAKVTKPLQIERCLRAKNPQFAKFC